VTNIPTGGRAPRIAALLAAGAVFGAGGAFPVAGAAQDIDALGAELARAESRADRLRLVAELGRTGDAAALAHLLGAAGDGDLAVRKRAAAAAAAVLRASGDRNPAALLAEEALSVDLSSAGQLAVVDMLDKQSPPKAAARGILRFLDRGDLAENVARRCVHKLAEPRYAEVDDARDGLLELLDTGETSVAAEAASALGRMRLSGSDKSEVVQTLVDQLGLGDDEAAVRESARTALGVVTGQGEMSVHDWRTWAVEEGYGDPVVPVPEEELEAERPPVVYPTVETETSSVVSSLVYVGVGTVAAALVAILLILRSAYTKRSADAIEARRRKARRSL
jgi:hypothetical protein